MLTASNGRASPAVLITGASSGIGAACAIDLDRVGYRVFAGVRSVDDGRKLQAQASPRLTPLRLDITQQEMIQEAAQCIARSVGPAGLWGLVNNAGIVLVSPVELIPIEEMRRQFEVNVIGHVAVTQAMLPLLRLARGRIVNVGSLNGVIAPPYFGPYAATKYAMEAITDCLRVELRQWGIEVSLIQPGSTSTPIWRRSFSTADRLAETIPAAAKALYDVDLAAVRDAAERLARNAMPVERVAQAVRKALTAGHPRTRYPVGLEAWLARMARRFLPDRFRDRILKRGLGLK